MKLFYVWLFITLLGALYACKAKASNESLWLARSCVGEAGWDAWQTNECYAMPHVYKKRAKITDQSILKQASQYSSAIKNFKNKRNPWVLHLVKKGTKPKKWPKNLNWDNFKFHWIMTLLIVDLFLDDESVDPLPKAIHYGCVFDTPPNGLKRIKTKFKNRFYRW